MNIPKPDPVIYKILNIVNNKFYIGSAIDFRVRKNNHLSLLRKRKHHSIHLQRAWDKYTEDKFQFTIIEFCSRDNLITREQFWIDTLKPEYNISPIAGSPLGVKHSEQSRINMSKGKLGTKHSPETRRKMSEAHKGKISAASLANLFRRAEYERAKTHCKYGHPFVGDNVVINLHGFRQCKQCGHDRKKKYKMLKENNE